MTSVPTRDQMILALSHPDLPEIQIAQLPGFNGDAALASRISLGAHDWHATGESALLSSDCINHLESASRRQYLCARCDTLF